MATGTTPAVPFGVQVGTTPLTSAMDALTNSMTKLQATANTATASIDALTGAISAHISRFVQLYNPAAVIRFEQATRDLEAAIGRALLPLLERFTLIVKQMGNAIAGLSPAGNKMIAVMAAVVVGLAAAAAATGAFFAVVSGSIVGLTILAGALGTATAIATAGISVLVGAVVGLGTALGSGALALGLTTSRFDKLKETFQRFAEMATSAFEALARRFDAVMESLRPLTDALGDLAEAQFEEFTTGLIVLMDALALAIELMRPQLMLAVTMIRYMTDGVKALTTAVRYFLGIESGSKMGSAEGLSVRNVRFGGVEDAWREAMKAAFSLGGGGREDYAKTSAGHLAKIEGYTQEIRDFLVNSALSGLRGIATVGKTVETFAAPAPSYVADRLRQQYD